jgi:genome maintenance exonuclease 1
MVVLTERFRLLPRYEPVRSHVDGERAYSTPLGYMPSVTTVLSGSRDNSGLEEWRESIGIERADEILKVACFRGTGHHENIERFLTDGSEPPFNLLLTPYWKSTRSFLERVERPVLLEGAIWHPDGFAGTLDCIAYLPEDGLQPTLLDWKTADTPRKPNKMYDYSLQCAAYVAAANHVYGHMGLAIERAAIVVALPDQEPQIVEIDSDGLAQYYQHFLARVQRFTFARRGKKR